MNIDMLCNVFETCNIQHAWSNEKFNYLFNNKKDYSFYINFKNYKGIGSWHMIVSKFKQSDPRQGMSSNVFELHMIDLESKYDYIKFVFTMEFE